MHEDWHRPGGDRLNGTRTEEVSAYSSCSQHNNAYGQFWLIGLQFLVKDTGLEHCFRSAQIFLHEKLEERNERRIPVHLSSCVLPSLDDDKSVNWILVET